MTAVAAVTASTAIAEPPVTTLRQLIRVLSDLTEDEDEIVATLLHMVERGSVRLVSGASATAA